MPASTARRWCSIRATARCSTFTSLPAYDPNAFAAGIDRATWASLNTDKLRPLQNRAHPGTLLARDRPSRSSSRPRRSRKAWSRPTSEVHCPGGATFYGRYFKCHLKGGHGTVDLRHAIEKSCNVYFYTVGNMLGVDKIHKWAEKLGLAGKTGIDLPNESREHRPVDRVEAEAHRREVVRR